MSGEKTATARTGTRGRGRTAAGLSALVRRIGRTPLLPLPSPRPGVRILGKAEWMNPGGSVKDRAAWGIVRAGLETGRLAGRRLLDASSGNTGIAYAMLGAAAGFEVTICLPESSSVARRAILDAYGAELVLTDPLEGSDGAIAAAHALAREAPERFWYPDQYGHEANWRAHYQGTAREIWRQTRGRVTHFVAGLGTTGTLVGAGRRLRELSPSIRVIGVEPAEPLHGIEGLKHLPTARVPGIYDPTVADEILFVATEEARERATWLARNAGLFVGVSAGAAYAATRRIAAALEEGTIVTILPDGGDRYVTGAWWGSNAG